MAYTYKKINYLGVCYDNRKFCQFYEQNYVFFCLCQ